VRADGSTIAFDAGCDRATLTDILGEVLASQVPAEGPLAERLVLPAFATLGRMELGYGDFTRLEPGALVVLAEREAGRLAVRVDTAVYDFRQADDGWTCLGSHMATLAARGARMDEANNSAEAAPEAAETVSLSGLRIALDFDIAQISVPVSTLSRWQAGSVVDIGLPALGDGLEVTIRAGGDVIGQGDLVRIDDRLAVRITRLTSSP
jgi:type III secretion protein Q